MRVPKSQYTNTPYKLQALLDPHCTKLVTGRLTLSMVRADYGMTQRELVRQTGLSISLISNLECGRERPTIFTLQVLELALDDRVYTIHYGWRLPPPKRGPWADRERIGRRKRLRTLRRRAGLQQWELAELAGISKNTIIEVERGRQKPRRSTLDLLAEVLGDGVYRCEYRWHKCHTHRSA